MIFVVFFCLFIETIGRRCRTHFFCYFVLGSKLFSLGNFPCVSIYSWIYDHYIWQHEQEEKLVA